MKTLSYFSLLVCGATFVATPLRAQDPNVMKLMPQIQALLGQLGKTDGNGQAGGANQGQQGQQGQNPQANPQAPADAQALLAQLMKAANAAAPTNGAANADGGQADLSKQLPQMLALLGQLLQSANGQGAANGGNADDAQAAKLLGQLQGLLSQMQQSADPKAGAGGAQAQDPQAAKPAPSGDLQNLVGLLLKGLNSAPAQDAEAAAAAAAANATAAINQTIKENTKPSPLKTGGLTTHGLQPSKPLSGTSQTDQDWRNLFPAKQ